MTIFAAATPAIKSGVAIIRISGERAGEALTVLTKSVLPTSRMAVMRKIYHPKNNELIDNALVLWFPAPGSFTGDDTAELHIHGSRAVINMVIGALSEMDGLRLAEPGEFSKRAFENGKMDLTAAEGLADLIDAETKAQARQALLQMQGISGKLYEKWREDIIAILAGLEAYIDFPDEDIPAEVANEVAGSIDRLRNEIGKFLDDNRRGEKIRNGLNVAIIGAPNVGKSSLLNCLAGRDAAIVSDIAGTTRDVIEVHLDLGGYPVNIADTAGVRDNADNIEQEGIRRALKKAEDADLKIVMFDITEDSNSVISAMVDEKTMVVFNKVDLSDKVELALSRTIPNTREREYISTKTGQGIDELINKIQKFAGDNIGSISDPVITRERHRSLLKECKEYLDNFSLESNIELAGEDLRMAANALGRITGRIDVEEILDKIFSSFCIGK